MASEIRRLETDPRQHSDLKAKALFETTAEVLIGLKKACEDYGQGSETAWQKAS